MSALNCLACGQKNSADYKFCEACGSSLDLRPCHSCEAINGPNARHCHNCGAAIPAGSSPPPLGGRVAPPPAPRAARRRPAAMLVIALLLVAGIFALGYHVYGLPQGLAYGLSYGLSMVRKIEAAVVSGIVSLAPKVAGPVPKAARVTEPERPQPVRRVRQETAPAVPVKRAQPLIAPKQAPPAELKQEAALPADAAQPPAANDAVPMRATRSQRGLTHTKPDARAPAPQTPLAPVPTAVRACPEAVAALGLCSAHLKMEGN